MGPTNGRISSLDLLFPTRLLLWQQEAGAEAEDAAVRDYAGVTFLLLLPMLLIQILLLIMSELLLLVHVPLVPW